MAHSDQTTTAPIVLNRERKIATSGCSGIVGDGVTQQ
jgi:hypothetical protein